MIISLLGLILICLLTLLFNEKLKTIKTVRGFFGINYVGTIISVKDKNREMAKKVLNGGYILFFRHAERYKAGPYQSVGTYDAVELHNNIQAENSYFAKMVCLNEEGKMQAKLLGDIFRDLNMPVSKLVSSPSCRARQTLAHIGEIDVIYNTLVHFNPWYETIEDFNSNVKEVLLKHKPEDNKNVIVSGHNSVITKDLFDEVFKENLTYELQEGGFYVIKHNGDSLSLIYKFNGLFDFTSSVYIRPEDN